ncbi:MAG: glycosyltransferase family 2 protein [bacterium]|nr:glycosyltransferase family 2 protein [bacterium]
MTDFNVSIIIPAFNEEPRLPATLNKLLAFFKEHPIDHEIFVVNDGSTDGTEEICKGFSREHANISCLKLVKNSGKGAALAAGIDGANKDWVLLYDADGATPIEELIKFKELCGEPDKVLIASRDIPGSQRVRPQPFFRHLMGRLFVRIRKWVIGLKSIEDTQCGFKLLPRSIAQKLFQDLEIKGFLFDVEILARADSLNIPIQELGVHWYDVPKSKVKVWREILKFPYSLWKIRRGLKRFRRAAPQPISSRPPGLLCP